jgi:hypothetical protein
MLPQMGPRYLAGTLFRIIDAVLSGWAVTPTRAKSVFTGAAEGLGHFHFSNAAAIFSSAAAIRSKTGI